MIRSAFFPADSVSHSESPIACAPFTVAILSTSHAGAASGSSRTAFCNPVTKNISRNMSRQLLLAAPSVPMATGTPSSKNLLTGAIPLASFKLEAGFVTT